VYRERKVEVKEIRRKATDETRKIILFLAMKCYLKENSKKIKKLFL